MVLNEQLKDFVNKVEAIRVNENAYSLTNEKISLITASKQLQGTIITSLTINRGAFTGPQQHYNGDPLRK